MMIEDVMDKLSTIINDTFDTTYAITNETSANEVEEWDSISHIELICEIESGFNIRFGLSELQDLKNVGEMAKLVVEKLA